MSVFNLECFEMWFIHWPGDWWLFTVLESGKETGWNIRPSQLNIFKGYTTEIPKPDSIAVYQKFLALLNIDSFMLSIPDHIHPLIIGGGL